MPASRSQVSSQVLDPEWKAIPLEKFSSAVSPLGAASHHWVHDIRKDDLFLVFRPVRLPCGGDMFETRLMMTVSAGVEILVCIYSTSTAVPLGEVTDPPCRNVRTLGS
jgi:hypothetical protein